MCKVFRRSNKFSFIFYAFNGIISFIVSMVNVNKGYQARIQFLHIKVYVIGLLKSERAKSKT